MIATLLFFLMLITSAAGFAFLAGSQRQHRATFSRRLVVFTGPVSALRWIGVALLCASLCPAVARDGATFGFVVWTLTITVSAFAVAAALAIFGRRLATPPKAGGG
jgi:hypothetical protein